MVEKDAVSEVMDITSDLCLPEEKRCWGIELWNDADAVLRHVSEQASFSDDCIKMHIEIQNLKKQYAKKFKRTIETYQTKLNSTVEGLSFNHSLEKLMENFHLFASTCESLARELTNGGNETMKRQIKRNKEVAKQCETVPKLQNTLNQDRRMLVNLWRNYFAAYRAKVKAEEVCNKAKQDLSPACNEVVKYDTIAKNKSTTFRHMKKVYAQELKQFTTQQRQYFTHGLKEVLCEFELNDWAQVSAIRQLLQCTSDADSECLDKMKSLTEAARILIDEINPGRDSSHVVESFSSQSLHPLDLPFLDLDKCPSALLEGNSSSLACYLLAKNANLSSIKTSRVSETLEVGVGNNVVIGGVCKDDKSLLKSAFICGIGIRPLHINEMSSSQLSDRINVLIKLQQQLEAELSLRGNLQNCLQTNSKSRQKDGLDPKVGCLIRAIFSINNQITRLVQRFNEISKQHKFTDWSSNENADRLNQDAIDSVEDSPYIWSDSAFSPSSQVAQVHSSLLSGDGTLILQRKALAPVDADTSHIYLQEEVYEDSANAVEEATKFDEYAPSTTNSMDMSLCDKQQIQQIHLSLGNVYEGIYEN